MHKKTVLKTIILSALALAVTTHVSTAHAQGTAFTYQGRLDLNSNLAQGAYDFTFALYDSATGGAQQGSLITDTGVGVTNGLFIVTLDFGNQFPGASRWLEISVATNGATSFTTLAPRQELTPTPYSIFAGAATQLTGPIANDNLPLDPIFTGTVTADSFSGDGAQVTGVNAVTLGGLAPANLWQIGGNAGANPTNGAFLGTTDTLPLELRVGGARALRLEYAYNVGYGTIVPNMIAGYPGNYVQAGYVGSTICGGGDSSGANMALASYATVLGGLGNTASGPLSIAGGNNCLAEGSASTALGSYSIAQGLDSFSSGYGSTASGNYASALGYINFATAQASVALGFKCHATGSNSMAAGYGAYCSFPGSFIWSDSSGPEMDDSRANQFLIQAAGGVGIGSAYPPPGGLRVATGGLAVSGTSSPNYSGAAGVFIENETSFGAIFAFNYGNNTTLPLCLNTPGGDVGIGTSTPTHTLEVAGVCAATSFVTTSDRNAKENFEPISAAEILDKVAGLPVTRWNFKTNDPSQHIGPMAQDFYAAFNVGQDDKHIATVDEGGIALAAIQGLNQKLEADAKAKDAEISDLKTQLADLKALVKDLAAKNPKP